MKRKCWQRDFDVFDKSFSIYIDVTNPQSQLVDIVTQYIILIKHQNRKMVHYYIDQRGIYQSSKQCLKLMIYFDQID